MKSVFGRLLMIEWQSIGWIFGVASGYLVTTAYEVSELVRYKKVISWSFVIQKICALVVVFFLGFILKAHIKSYVKNEDIQAGVYAMVGAIGFSVFGIMYKVVTNKQAWTDLVFIFFRRWAGIQTTDHLKNKEQDVL